MAGGCIRSSGRMRIETVTMQSQPCSICRWPALALQDGLCQPCRIRAGETIPGHRLVATPQVSPSATLIVCTRDGGGASCEALQLALEA